MIEIRIHGRGGQGAVTTSQILAIAAFYDGKQSQAFPNFGVERAGAPVESFVRIDNKPINLRCHVYNPYVAIVLDPSLLDVLDVTSGVKDKGLVIVNSNKDRNALGIDAKHYCVYTFDATSTALKIFKKPIVNTLVLGAFSAITNLVTLESLKNAVDESFSKKEKQVAELNKQAIEEVYNSLKETEARWKAKQE